MFPYCSTMIWLLAVATLLVLSEQCQEIRLIAEDGAVVVGRSMEFAILDSYLLTEPEGSEHTMPLPPNCAEPFRFENKYHSFKVRWKLDSGVWSKGDADGMNSAGLSFAGLYFPQFSYFPDAEEVTGAQCDNAVPHVRLGEYVLATFGSVQEIIDAIENDEFPMVYSEEDFGITHPIHYQFIDTTGEGMVLEYTKDGRRMFNNTVGAFTNSPTYDWHMENLRNYPHLQSVNREGYDYTFRGQDFDIPVAGSGSGLSGIPGDYTSVSRFVKAATLVRFAQKPKNRNEALWQSFHLMNAADIPRGIVQIPVGKHSSGKKKSRQSEDDEPQEFMSDSTSYIVVKSLTEGCMYYRAYMDISIKRICFKNMRKDVTRWRPIESRWQNSYKDVNPKNMEVFEFDGVN